jgi:hypothetical protein
LKRATSCDDPFYVGIKYLFWRGSQYFRHFGRLTSPISLSPTPVLFLYPPVQSRPAPCSYATPPALICTLDLTCTLIRNPLMHASIRFLECGRGSFSRTLALSVSVCPEFELQGLLHKSGGSSPVSNLGGPGSIAIQFVWVLWWTECSE